jgi:hypothetical protein
MEQLPYIDEHRTRIRATPDAVWEALVAVLRSQLNVPTPLRRVWGLTPDQRRGTWSAAVRTGDTVPGFAVVEARTEQRLALRGEHRFSRYELVFTLEPAGTSECTLGAQSWAAFPGVAGAAYRTLVIGTGGHRFAVRRLLHSVARRS